MVFCGTPCLPRETISVVESVAFMPAQAIRQICRSAELLDNDSYAPAVPGGRKSLASFPCVTVFLMAANRLHPYRTLQRLTTGSPPPQQTERVTC